MKSINKFMLLCVILQGLLILGMGSDGFVKLNEIKSSNLFNTRFFRSEFSNLPSNFDLNKIIDTADVLLITKTIQSVV